MLLYDLSKASDRGKAFVVEFRVNLRAREVHKIRYIALVAAWHRLPEDAAITLSKLGDHGLNRRIRRIRNRHRCRLLGLFATGGED